MQTEKEFKELARAWLHEAEEEKMDELTHYDGFLGVMMELMWRSYNQGIEDYVRQDS